MNFIKKYKLYLALLALATVNLVIFYYAFGFHENNDTGSFIETINFFRGNYTVWESNRYMVPFYPIVGAKLLFFLSPAHSIIVTNIIFYYGLLLLTYGLITRVFQSKWMGFVTALLVATNYAMIRYGLTQVQDIGGYFWCLFTMYSIWRWREQKHMGWLLLGSIGVAFGILTKESGGMGALFAGVIILSELKNDGWKKIIKHLLIFAVAPFITIVFNSLRGREIGFNSFTYIVDTWKYWAPGNYTLLRWFGINVSTYNLAWIAVLAGVILMFKARKVINRDVWVYFIAVLPVSLTYLAWPVFISRTVFISGWFFLPLAAYSLFRLYEKGGRWKYLSVVFVVFLMMSSYLLQNTLKYAHVFTIIDQCHKDPICSWNTFWQSRDSASETM